MLYKVIYKGQVIDTIEAGDMFEAIERADAFGYSPTRTELMKEEPAPQALNADVRTAVEEIIANLEFSENKELTKKLEHYLNQCQDLPDSIEYIEGIVLQFQRSFQEKALLLFLESWEDD